MFLFHIPFSNTKINYFLLNKINYDHGPEAYVSNHKTEFFKKIMNLP